jgi:hypothetical protein
MRYLVESEVEEWVAAVTRAQCGLPKPVPLEEPWEPFR